MYAPKYKPDTRRKLPNAGGLQPLGKERRLHDPPSNNKNTSYLNHHLPISLQEASLPPLHPANPTMPTNRPFLANFLAAFRAHSALQNASVSPSTTTTTPQATYSTNAPSSTHAPNPATAARPITTKTTPSVGVTTAAVQAAVAATGHLSHHHTRHPSTSPVANPSPGFGTRSRQRRGSDSSSEGGFRDALGNEKWYIGGRTAQGEERFYRLAMVRRERSGDRLSVDRLSL